MIQVESQDGGDGGDNLCGAEGHCRDECPQWEKAMIKEMEKDLRVQRLGRKAKSMILMNQWRVPPVLMRVRGLATCWILRVRVRRVLESHWSKFNYME